MSCIAPVVISIRNFVPEMDSAWLHDLWHRTMHGRWAISLQAMLHTISNAALVLVAECEGKRSGLCAVDSQRGHVAGLILLLVEPARQRCGVGAELMTRVETSLRDRNVRRLTLGAGNGDYFWPGLPEEQKEALCFFKRLGFQEEEASDDLIQKLEDFRTPDWVANRLTTSGATLRVAEPAQNAQISAFEKKHFPAWTPYFENEMEQGGYKNILFAKAPDGGVLGTILLKHEALIPWTDTNDRMIGTLNTLGVAPQQQGQGIGLALTAGAMDHLRRRGCSHCLIQWTGLSDWYGKLGAERWAHYHMASKVL